MLMGARWKKLAFWGCLSIALVATGCTEYALKSPSPDVKTFFVAGREADYLSTMNCSSGDVDLSAYSHLAGVKYPPTQRVDVLSRPPSRPYKSFAVLEYKPAASSSTHTQLEGLKSKAREIGADAIILCHPGVTQGLPGLPPSANLQAVAIKYKLNHGPG
jgi:hypothetical protein